MVPGKTVSYKVRIKGNKCALGIPDYSGSGIPDIKRKSILREVFTQAIQKYPFPINVSYVFYQSPCHCPWQECWPYLVPDHCINLIKIFIKTLYDTDFSLQVNLPNGEVFYLFQLMFIFRPVLALGLTFAICICRLEVCSTSF